jgi:hypothetical protein
VPAHRVSDSSKSLKRHPRFLRTWLALHDKVNSEVLKLKLKLLPASITDSDPPQIEGLHRCVPKRSSFLPGPTLRRTGGTFRKNFQLPTSQCAATMTSTGAQAPRLLVTSASTSGDQEALYGNQDRIQKKHLDRMDNNHVQRSQRQIRVQFPGLGMMPR